MPCCQAYALGGSNDGFSGEAVRTLLTEVENNRTNILVVLAGYEDKMLTNDDSLMKADPGMPRRFCTHIHLPDYSPHQVGESNAGLHTENGLCLRSR